MDNAGIARIFDEISDVLEIKAENPFRIRAYRNAATTVVNLTSQLADLAPEELVKIPGIGKDLASKIREIVETGTCRYHTELLAEFPPTLLDLLRLQGIGPKTVLLLYRSFGIATLGDLEQAAREGKLRGIKGLGSKKEEQVLRALEERRKHAGRHLLADAIGMADAIIGPLRDTFPAATFDIVGSVRRGCDTCGDLDILATHAPAAVMDAFASDLRVERIVGKGDTKSSVLLRGGYQADLRLVPAESRGAALQYFTGSKAHNIALRDRAIQRGMKLNEYGLFALDSDTAIAGSTEEGIYEALGLDFIPPELREQRGELAAAQRHALPPLIELRDLRGDLHAHTSETDGRHDIETMAIGARDAGLTYLAITDHSQALAMANGLDEHRALAHAARIRDVGSRLEGITLLAGIECDIRADGTMDLSDDCLAQLDVVVASVHSRFQQDEQQMTDRILAAIESPYVDIIGHPTGRKLLQRDPYRLDMERIVAAAAAHGVALEINCQIYRLDLNDIHTRLARDRGVSIVISSDAHNRHAFGTLRWGVQVARRAWLTAADVLNTLPADQFRARLRRNRTRT